MLHDWVKSEESFTTYHQLLTYLQDASPSHELVLSLAALLLFYSISYEVQPTKSTPRASLADLDRFLNGHFAIGDSWSFLSTMLWTFLWKLTSEVESSASNALIQLLEQWFSSRKEPSQSAVRLVIGRSSEISMKRKTIEMVGKTSFVYRETAVFMHAYTNPRSHGSVRP